jgi:EAL and modified HD-GYP domain-containing signal transduction protein
MDTSHSENFFFARQPILNREGSIIAYELLYRSSERNLAPKMPRHATEQVIVNALNMIGLNNLIEQGTRAFINIDEKMLFDDILHTIPKSSFVLELLEDIVYTPQIIERIETLRNAGFTFALDDVICDTEVIHTLKPVLPHVDIVKLDLPQSLSKARPYINLFKEMRISVLAEKVETETDYNAFKDIGCDLFQGFFFARPTLISGTKVNPKLALIFRMIELLSRDKQDDVISLFEQDAALTVQLLRYINSAAFSFKSDISSIRQSVALLGNLHLRQWLTMMSYVIGSRDGFQSPLLKLAQERAAMMRLLAEAFVVREVAETAAFIGLISLIDALFHQPMGQLLEELRIDRDIAQVLLDEAATPLGDLYRIVRSVENFDHDAITGFLRTYKIPSARFNQVLQKSYELTESFSRHFVSG